MSREEEEVTSSSKQWLDSRRYILKSRWNITDGRDFNEILEELSGIEIGLGDANQYCPLFVSLMK